MYALLDMTCVGARFGVHSFDRGLLECTYGELNRGTSTYECNAFFGSVAIDASARLILSNRGI